MSSTQIAPGWYPAQGDPAGTIRYWNGNAWQGDAHPVSTPTEPQVQGYQLVAQPETPTDGISEAERRGLAENERLRQVQRARDEAARSARLAQLLRKVGLALSFFKAIPLAALFYLWIVSSVPEGFVDTLRERGFDALSVILLTGAGLLVIQLVGIFSGRPIVTLLPAAAMALLDMYVTAVSLRAAGIFVTAFIGVIAMTQVMIAVWAFSETFEQ